MTKYILSTFLCLTQVAFAQQADLTVDFKLEKPDGELFIRLVDDDNQEIDLQRVMVNDKITQYTFQQLQEGKSYAIAVFQDLNQNSELDTYFVGIPKEPYGFSNDVRGGISGPPQLKEQLVFLSGDQRIKITVE